MLQASLRGAAVASGMRSKMGGCPAIRASGIWYRRWEAAQRSGQKYRVAGEGTCSVYLHVPGGDKPFEGDADDLVGEGRAPQGSPSREVRRVKKEVASDW